MKYLFQKILKITIFGMLFAGIFGSLSAEAAWNEGEEELFREANEAYREGHYVKAIEAYQQLIGQYPKTSLFYYNLGNAFYRNQQLGDSILAYEISQKLSPRDADTRNNLRFVRSLLEYRVEDKRNWYLRIGEKILEFFREKEIIFAVGTCYALLLFFGCVALLTKRQNVWVGSLKFGFGLLVLALFIWGGKSLETYFFRDAIVLENNAEVRYGPSRNDQIAFRLGEGLKVYVVNRRPEWSRIVLVDGQDGWIRNAAIGEVKVRNEKLLTT